MLLTNDIIAQGIDSFTPESIKVTYPRTHGTLNKCMEKMPSFSRIILFKLIHSLTFYIDNFDQFTVQSNIYYTFFMIIF